MPIQNPTQLVDEFKKSGEFDKLRRELLAQFRASDASTSFMTRVEEIAKQKLSGDQKLQYLPEAAITREVMQELDRYPIVERAVGEVKAFSDPVFAVSVRQQISTVLQNDRNPPSSRPQSTRPNHQDGPVSHSDRFPSSTDDKGHPNPTPPTIAVAALANLESGQPQVLSTHAATPIPPPQQPAQTPVANGEETLRSVHFNNTSRVEPARHQAEEPGSPDSAMVESPLTEDRPADRVFP